MKQNKLRNGLLQSMKVQKNSTFEVKVKKKKVFKHRKWIITLKLNFFLINFFPKVNIFCLKIEIFYQHNNFFLSLGRIVHHIQAKIIHFFRISYIFLCCLKIHMFRQKRDFFLIVLFEKIDNFCKYLLIFLTYCIKKFTSSMKYYKKIF